MSKHVKVHSPLLLLEPILNDIMKVKPIFSWTVLHQGLLFGLRKFLPESLREEYSEDPGTGCHHPHDEHRSWQPVNLQQVQEEAGDAAYPGHQGAETYCLQRERELDLLPRTLGTYSSPGS